MARKSAIDALDPAIRSAVLRAIDDGATIDDIVDLVRDMGGEVSRSSVGRYKKGFAELAKQQRDMRATAEAFGREFGDADDKQGRMMVQLMTSIMTRAVMPIAMGDEVELDGKELAIRLTPPDGFGTKEVWWQEVWIDEWLRDNVAQLIAASFDPARRSFFGQDFARSSDLSVVACGQLDERSRLLNPLVVEMRNVPFRAQKRVLDFLVRTMPQWSTGKMDARGNGQQIAEDMRQDWGMERIEAVMATQQTYLDRMPRTKTRFEDRTILIPQAEELIDDLRQVKLARGIPQVIDRVADKADGASGKRHGDYAIALMNLVCAADEDVQPIDLHTAGQVRAHAGDFRTTGTGFGTVARRDGFGARGAW